MCQTLWFASKTWKSTKHRTPDDIQLHSSRRQPGHQKFWSGLIRHGYHLWMRRSIPQENLLFFCAWKYGISILLNLTRQFLWFQRGSSLIFKIACAAYYETTIRRSSQSFVSAMPSGANLDIRASASTISHSPLRAATNPFQWLASAHQVVFCSCLSLQRSARALNTKK